MRQRDDETTLANAARLSDGPSPRPSGAQRELNDQADLFEDVIAEIQAEMRGVRDELARLRAIALPPCPLAYFLSKTSATSGAVFSKSKASAHSAASSSSDWQTSLSESL